MAQLQLSRSTIQHLVHEISQTIGLPVASIRVEHHNLQFQVCCRVPKSKQRLLKKRGIEKLSVQAGGVYFTTAALKKESNVYHTALKLYNEAQKEAAEQIMGVAFT